MLVKIVKKNGFERVAKIVELYPPIPEPALACQATGIPNEWYVSFTYLYDGAEHRGACRYSDIDKIEFSPKEPYGYTYVG